MPVELVHAAAFVGIYQALVDEIGVVAIIAGARRNGVPMLEEFVFAEFDNAEFRHHAVEMEDFTKSKYLEKILQRVTYETPQDFESLLSIKGVGGKTIRALSLVSEIIYGAKPSYEDPARYSFAHGGKDATPYPIDRQTYDQTIEILHHTVRKSKIEPAEKDKALRRISK